MRCNIVSVRNLGAKRVHFNDRSLRQEVPRVSKKMLIWLGLTAGSGIGGYLPALWGGDLISFSSVLLSAAGGIVGIWLGYRFGE